MMSQNYIRDIGAVFRQQDKEGSNYPIGKFSTSHGILIKGCDVTSGVLQT
jgi:hypothetical protein